MLQNMAGTEQGSQNPEDLRIVVVREGQLLEVTPSAQDGSSGVLSRLRQTLITGINSGLLVTNPFINVESAKKSDKQAPVKAPQYYPDLSEEGELERQRVEAADRVAVPLGIDRNKYLAKLPTRFPKRGEDYDRLALNVPLIDVNTSTFGFSWYETAQAALFYDPDNPEKVLRAYVYPGLKNVQDWKDPRKGVEPFPNVPHSVWIQDGTRYREVNGLTPRMIRGQLEIVERAGNHWKGLSQAVLRPDMIKGKPWDLIGGHLKVRGFGPDYLPYVGWLAEPWFNDVSDDYANPYFQALVSGSEYIAA